MVNVNIFEAAIIFGGPIRWNINWLTILTDLTPYMVGYHELPIVPQKVTDSLARLINILVKCIKHFLPLEVY